MLRFTNILPAFKFSLKASWANAEVHRPFDGKVQNVTLIPGIGIGPEITSKKLFKPQALSWMFLKLLMFQSNSIL